MLNKINIHLLKDKQSDTGYFWEEIMTLRELEIGKTAVIKNVGGDGSLRQHFLDMGILPGTKITLTKYAPMGDPMELVIHGYNLTLRLSDAENIGIEETEQDETESENNTELKNHKEHPGYGEEGKFHAKNDEHPLPKDTVLTFALAGNQNCGKTTLFNRLTGSNQHVGNFPGVTVDQKSGQIKSIPNTLVTDLPGIYSLSPYTAEEIVSREFILNDKPKGIINIIDATNIERNLYLTLQLMELDIPVVLALNMMDEVRGNGGTIKVNVLEEMLGIPIVPISASKDEGVDELVRHALHIAKYQEKPGRNDFCDESSHGGAVHRCIHGIMQLIEDHAKEANIPCRFAATKLIEGDELILKALNLTQNEKETIEHIVVQMERERNLDRAASIADMRFSFIHNLCKSTVVKPKESIEHKRSRSIDRVLTGKYTAIPSFIGIMALVFFLTFNVIGGSLQKLFEKGIISFTNLTDKALLSFGVNEAIHSLIIDGIFAGVGSVLSFVPIIIVLFFFLSMLEDSGYMARVAFMMDKLLRKIGLSGRSIVPMLIGFGCTVPGVMASRTLPSARDRKMTIILTPFMSCTAKLPVYAFFSAVFFPKYAGLILIGLYLLGMIIGIFVALISKNTIFKGEPVPFVMELPNYRLPGAKNVAHLLWDKAKDFIQRAFSVIFIASIIVWFLQTFNYKLNIVEDSKDSILALIAGLLAPIFKPLGFDDWRIVTALIAGFMAKESVVSTLSVLFSGTSSLLSAFSTEAAAALLVFCLLYTPCIAAIASVKRELSTKWALAIVFGQCFIAWICAFITASITKLVNGINLQSIIVLGLVFIYLAVTVIFMIKNRKKSCSGKCSNCAGCK